MCVDVLHEAVGLEPTRLPYPVAQTGVLYARAGRWCQLGTGDSNKIKFGKSSVKSSPGCAIDEVTQPRAISGRESCVKHQAEAIGCCLERDRSVWRGGWRGACDVNVKRTVPGDRVRVEHENVFARGSGECSDLLISTSTIVLVIASELTVDVAAAIACAAIGQVQVVQAHHPVGHVGVCRRIGVTVVSFACANGYFGLRGQREGPHGVGTCAATFVVEGARAGGAPAVRVVAGHDTFVARLDGRREQGCHQQGAHHDVVRCGLARFVGW